ncbi:MAG TPA: molybdopterin adenylyltransferase [Spirochaetota bacterium]|nr:molybdopterin adenylyltransferase [Spirochaetota bacterium]
MRKIRAGIITVSDRASRGERNDVSGPEIARWAENMDIEIVEEAIVPDEIPDIRKSLTDFVEKGFDLILTTGGTGFAPRDVTPEATRAVIDREAPGFAEAMRAKSLTITPHAVLSRAVSGICRQSLIINLPGSPKAVRENLGFIEKAIPHAIMLLRNEVKDCGSN